MKFNDLDLKNWQQLDINVDSLWLIAERDKTGKHKNIYHGNFIPQIPYQLIKRFTKENDIVFEPFMGSGTTLFECEKLNRKYIGFDINPKMIEYVDNQMQNDIFYKNFFFSECDCLNRKQFEQNIKNGFAKLNTENYQLLIMHPPYMDIIKFTNLENDLSNISNIDVFIDKFILICKLCINYLELNRYFAVVIGDVYKNSEVVPLSFYVLNNIKKKFNVKLKGIIIKNIEGNRGKIVQNNIWRYRALKNDYYIFKHEYILIFKRI